MSKFGDTKDSVRGILLLPFEDENLSFSAMTVLTVAQREAASLGSESVRPEHLLLALMQNYREVGQIFDHLGCSPNDFRKALQSRSTGTLPPITKIDYSEDVIALVRSAARFAKLLHFRLTGTRHLFHVLMDDSHHSQSAIGLMTELGYPIPSLRAKALEATRLTNADGVHGYIQRAQVEFYGEKDRPTGFRSSSEKITNSKELPPTFDSLDDVSAIFSEKTKAIFRGARIYIDRSLNGPVASKIELEHLFGAFSDLKDPKFQLVLEAIGACNFNDFRKLVVLLELQTPAMRGSKFESVELSDPVVELVQRAMKLTVGTIEPEHFLTCLLRTSFKCGENILVDHIAKVLGGARQTQSGRKTLRKATSFETSGYPLSPSVYRVLRRSKSLAAHAGNRKITVVHLVPAWIAECYYSESEFALQHHAVLDSLREYSGNNSQTEPFEGAELRCSKFGVDIHDILYRAKVEALYAEIERVDINHFGAGLLEVLAKDPSFEEKTSVDLYSFTAALRQMILASSSPWSQRHNVIDVSPEELDDGVAGPFWAVPCFPLDANARISKFELLEALSFRSDLVVQFAVREAVQTGRFGVSVEEIFTGLLCETLGPNFRVFDHLGVDSKIARDVLSDSHIALSRRQQTHPFPDPQAVQLLEIAWLYARRWRDVLIEPEHLLYAMTKHPRGVRMLESLDVDSQELTAVLRRLMLEERKPFWIKHLERAAMVPESVQGNFLENLLRMNNL